VGLHGNPAPWPGRAVASGAPSALSRPHPRFDQGLHLPFEHHPGHQEPAGKGDRSLISDPARHGHNGRIVPGGPDPWAVCRVIVCHTVK
jgi:hypothetical protein